MDLKFWRVFFFDHPQPEETLRINRMLNEKKKKKSLKIEKKQNTGKKTEKKEKILRI